MASNSRPRPAWAETPEKPATSTAASAAAAPESTNARVRTRGTRTPARAAARSLSPVATSVRPKSERISHTAAAPTTTQAGTAQGSQPPAVPRPNSRKLCGSTPLGEPPVQ
ncbi:hypothetical protein GCM10020295_76250 [Streptomyces cinereospinus]